MIDDPKHKLEFGDLPLVTKGGNSVYSIHTLAEETDWGNPAPVMTVIKSLLGDGSTVVIDRDDNREAVIAISFEASNSTGLSEAEQAIVEQTRRRNLLVWTPPDKVGPSTVFEVVTSWWDQIFDDKKELILERGGHLHLVLAPYARSVDEVVSAALETGVTTVSIDDCSSTAGWTATAYPSAGDFTDEGDEFSMVAFGHLMVVSNIEFVRTGAAQDFSATPYLFVDWRVNGNNSNIGPRAFADGAALSVLATIASPDDPAYKRTYFVVPDSSVTELRFQFISQGTRTAYLTQVSRTNVPPFIGTGRQRIRTVEVKGSARTQGSLAVENETDALGTTLVYTRPDDGSPYQPPLRTWRISSSAVTTDASLISGSRNAIDTPITYEIPVAWLPKGPLQLVARLRNTGSAARAVEWTAQTYVGGVAVGLVQSGSAICDFNGTNWNVYSLGSMVLPPTDVADGSAASVRITLVSADPAGDTIDIDEGWIFHVAPNTALTWVNAQTNQRLWIETPTLARPAPAVWIGDADDKSDAYHPGPNLVAWGTHQFTPEGVVVFTVTAQATDCDVSLRHYPRWHTHAAI